MNLRKATVGFGLAALALLAPRQAEASLSVFQTFVGNYGVSTDGFGSTSQSGTISAEIPAGATVVGAYLYSSTFGSSPQPGGTLGGTSVSYSTALGTTVGLQAFRADVTNIVANAYDGVGGVYNFAVTETNGLQDGEALVVVYQQASLPTSTIGILDGFSATGGDSTSVNFADPLDPTGAGFFAEMRLGIGFGAGGEQFSRVTVNGTEITSAAGAFDDGALANGALITVGGYDDPFTPFPNPTQAQDHERYDLASAIDVGDTSIVVQTINPSNNDNIFLAVFRVLGEGGVNAPPPDTDPDPSVPEPATFGLLGIGLAGAALRRRRSRK